MNPNTRGLAAAILCLLAPATYAQSLDCAALANSALAEPAGYAAQCGIPDNATKPQAPSPLAPTDTAFVHNIRGAQPTTGFGRHVLNNMAGTTVISPTARVVFAMDFNPAATTLYTVDSAVAASPVLETTNTTTGVVTPGPAITGLSGQGVSDLVINPTSGAAFISTFDGTNSQLYSFNLTTGAATLIGSMGAGIVIDLAINCAGAMYAHDITTDTLHSVNTATGARTLIGAHGLAANFAQGMDFDNNDGRLYAWVYTGAGTYTFGTFNLTTGAITALNTNTPAGEWEGAIQNTCAPAEANLSITKTATAPTPIVIGSQITYNLTVANAGPGAATAVVVTDPLPGNTTPVSNTCGATLAGNTLTWNVGALANGANATCGIVVRVAAPGPISNTASVASSTTDPVPGNNSSTAALGGIVSSVPATSTIGLWLLGLLTLGFALVALQRRS